MSSPKISVYIVNHNYGQYLEKAIESVLSQTIKDFEIIVIDNGSTDNSRDKLEKFYNNKKIKIILQKNIGLNSANNVALKIAKGKYIIRLDADDYFDKHALEIMYQKFKRNPKLALVFPDYYLVDENNDIIEIVRRHDFSEVELLDQPAHGACSMIKSDILKAVGGYDESYHCQDGWDIWIKLIKKYGVGNINLPLFFYRQHNSNLTRNEKRLLETRSRILKKNIKLSRKKNCLVIIPVRGKGIDKSSIATNKLGDKLVIDWTISAALNAKRVGKVVITTPDDKIIKHVEENYSDDVIILKRSWKLAKFGSSIDETLTDLFENLPTRYRSFESVCVLFVEYPFRDSKYIDMSVDTMDLFGTERVISMRSTNHIFYKHSGNTMIPVQNSYFVKQDKEQYFIESGGIYLVKRGTMFRDKHKDTKIGHINVDETSGLNISNDFGWELAKKIVKKN